MSFESFNYNFAPRIEGYGPKFAAIGSIKDPDNLLNPLIADLKSLKAAYSSFKEMHVNLTNFIDHLIHITKQREGHSMSGEELYRHIVNGFDQSADGKLKSVQFSSYQQAALLEFVYSRNFERQVIANHNLLPTYEHTDQSGTQWQGASFTNAGRHTLGHNSDYQQKPKSGSPLLGIVCDGVTNKNVENSFEFLAGRRAAQLLADNFAKAIDMQGSMKTLVTDQSKEAIVIRELYLGLNRTPQALLARLLNRADRGKKQEGELDLASLYLKERYGAVLGLDSDNGYFIYPADASHGYKNAATQEELTTKILNGCKYFTDLNEGAQKDIVEHYMKQYQEGGLQALFASFDIKFDDLCQSQFESACLESLTRDFVEQTIVDLGEEINQAICKESEPNSEITVKSMEDLNLTGGTTLVAALDMGEDILLISLGDSRILALDDKARVLSVNQSTQTNEGTQVFGYCFNQGEAEDWSLHNIAGLSFATVKKDKVKALILASDGLTEPYERQAPVLYSGTTQPTGEIRFDFDSALFQAVARHNLSGGPAKLISTLVQEAINAPGMDDKTVQVLIK